MDSSLRQRRFERVRESLAAARADALIVPSSADFRWLTGAVARVSERLVAFVLPRTRDPFCVVPRLEADMLAAECPWLELEVWDEHEDPYLRLSKRLDFAQRPTVLVGEGLRVATTLRLAADASCRSAAEALAPLRAIKDADEIAAMVEAGEHADRIVEEAAERAKPGMTERELARWILDRFESLGDAEPWAIVASGPNSANPHHFSSDRRIAEGEVLLLDLGAYTRGYGSDITRTFFLGEPPSDVLEVYRIVNEARGTGIAAVRDGAIPEEVDAAARGVIERAGHGPHFTHRLGHGVGLEVHELPYLVKGNRAPLRAGMAHSVEPGIYLPGRFGVRLEDLVIVEERGARVLNHAPFDPRPRGRRPVGAPAS